MIAIKNHNCTDINFYNITNNFNNINFENENKNENYFKIESNDDDSKSN